MKTLKHWSKPVFEWIDRYKYVIPAFFVGTIFGKIHFLDLQVSIYTVDQDHVLEGELTVENGDEIVSKSLDIGFNYDHRMRGEHD